MQNRGAHTAERSIMRDEGVHTAERNIAQNESRGDIREQNEQVKKWLWRYRGAKKDIA